MIKLKKVRNEKRKWLIKFTNFSEETYELNLVTNSLTNKFDIVKHFLEEISNLVPDFEQWYYELFKKYLDSEYNSELILNECDKIIQYAKEYIDAKNINFNEFVDLTKVSKTSITFYVEDIYAIDLAATCLKIYSIYFCDKDLRVPENIDKLIYQKFIQMCVDNKTTDKIFDLIKMRTYRSSITDRYMWDLIKMTVLKTPETYSMSLFNFLMMNLISTISIESNPILYLISIANDRIRWMMCNIYKEKIIYSEEFGGTDDIYGSTQTKESFHLFTCNDVITRSAKIGLHLIEDYYDMDALLEEKVKMEEFISNDTEGSVNFKNELAAINTKISESQDEFDKLRDRLDDITLLDPVMRFLTLPIASQVLEIPYKYLLTTPPKHITLIGVLLHDLSKDLFLEQYPVLMEFLISCPSNNSSAVSKSSYQIRNIEQIINNKSPLFGFHSKTLQYEIISPICGLLCASKRNLISIINGKKINKITYNDLENDAIGFYLKLYSNGFEKEFAVLRKKLDEYL